MLFRQFVVTTKFDVEFPSVRVDMLVHYLPVLFLQFVYMQRLDFLCLFVLLVLSVVLILKHFRLSLLVLHE